MRGENYVTMDAEKYLHGGGGGGAEEYVTMDAEKYLHGGGGGKST